MIQGYDTANLFFFAPEDVSGLIDTYICEENEIETEFNDYGELIYSSNYDNI